MMGALPASEGVRHVLRARLLCALLTCERVVCVCVCVCVCVWIYMYKHTHVYDKWLWMKACTGCSGPARERVGCMHVLHIDASKNDSHTESAC